MSAECAASAGAGGGGSSSSHVAAPSVASGTVAPAERRVVVTGGTGLFGKAIEAIVSAAGGGSLAGESWHFLSSADCDLRDSRAVDALFARLRPTHVLHLAAKVGGLFANMTYKADFVMDNLAINTSVISACHAHGVKKAVSCLSTCIFPDRVTYPIDETVIHDGPPHASNAGYAYAKRLLDVMNRAFHDQHGSNFTSIVPTNIYGPFDNFNLQDGHVLPALIHKCYIAKQRGTDFVVLGSGKPLRQFIHSRDLARLAIYCLRSYDEVEPIILSVDPADEVSIGDVARLVVKAMDFKGNLVFDTSKSDGQFKKTASNAKLRALLPTFEFTPLEVGIRETVEWFIENYETARK